ncbi:uncharacterized protein LOC142521860 [Primulina tabacum]|uniref:uncharacterized protein LOC142521860 n=1 Tax=Primulina tabacum TaxID=48773 RepID=UPI003F5A3837
MKTDERPLCKECNRYHYGKCMWGTYKCFRCGGMWHKSTDCPKHKQPATGRAYVMHAEKAESKITLITDSGATHCFIYVSFVKRLRNLPEDLESRFKVTVPSGKHMVSTSMVKDVELKFQRNFVRADLIVLPMPEFDIILGMEWLTLNGAAIDFQRRSSIVEDVEVVKDFPNFFPDDVSGIPP